MLFQGGKFQWARLTNLITLARDGLGASAAAGGPNGTPSTSSSRALPAASSSLAVGAAASASSGAAAGDGLDLSETLRDAVRLVMTDAKLRAQLLEALTEDNRLHVDEVAKLLQMLGPGVDPARLVGRVVADLPTLSRQVMLSWADRVLVS